MLALFCLTNLNAAVYKGGNDKMLYKILTKNQWEEFNKNKVFKGSEVDIKDGFIHLSFKEQIDSIRTKFFKGISPIYLVVIKSEKINKDSLKVEANKKGGNEYPHYYAEISLDMIESTQIIE